MGRLVCLRLLAIFMLCQLPGLSWAFARGRGAYCATQMALATQSCSLIAPRRGRYPVSAVAAMQPSVGGDTNVSENGVRHHRRHREDPEQSVFEECCRWLNELDDFCICDYLMMHLPIVLTQLNHAYVIEVSDSCEVTFECDGN